MTRVELVLVEDNPADADLTMEIIAETGCAVQVTVTENVERAQEVIREKMKDGSIGPVLVLLDLKLPKGDGLEILTFIRHSFSKDALEVVVLTGSQHPQDRIRATELSVDNFFIKSIDIEEFAELVVKLKEILISLGQVRAPWQ